MSYETISLFLLMKTISLSHHLSQKCTMSLEWLGYFIFHKMKGSFWQWGIALLKCSLWQIKWINSRFNLTNRIHVVSWEFKWISEINAIILIYFLNYHSIDNVLRFIWKLYFTKNRALNCPRSLVFYSFYISHLLVYVSC